jgi:hemolysin activation/secretion protein
MAASRLRGFGRNNGRLRVNVEFDADPRTTLGDLDELSFNYYIDSSDRTDVIPVIRLIIDANGFTPAGGFHFDANSLILGYSIALGSGNGTANIYMDNLQVGGVTMDFYA